MADGEIKVGDRFWSIASSSESQGFGDYDPVEPWQGRVMRILDQGRPLVALSRVGDLHPDGDDDSNATSYLETRELYPTEEDAIVAYWRSFDPRLDDLYRRTQELRREQAAWGEKVRPILLAKDEKLPDGFDRPRLGVQVDSATGDTYDDIGKLIESAGLEDSSGLRRHIYGLIAKGEFGALGLTLGVDPEVLAGLAWVSQIIRGRGGPQS